MSGVNPGKVKGEPVDGTSTNPVEVAVGAGEAQGNASTCQAEATEVSGLIGCVHVNTTELLVIELVANAAGFLHAGGSPQVMLDTHPALVALVSLLNTNVKHPLAPVAVKGPGRAPVKSPQYEPAKPPGTFPAKLSLASKVAGETVSPS